MFDIQELINIISTVGGIFLIIGAFFLYKGNAFYSLFAYFIADLCWISLAIFNHAIFGSIVILIGIILGLLTWVKMNQGTFVKNLKK